MTSLCITCKQTTWSCCNCGWCAARSEAQKCKFVENRMRINGRRVPVVAAAETAI